MKEKCREIREELGIYAFEPIDDEVAAHLESCPDCRIALERLTAGAAEISKLLPEPSDALIESTSASIANALKQTRANQGKRRVLLFAIPAAAAIILSALFFFWDHSQKLASLVPAPSLIAVDISHAGSLGGLSWLSVEGVSLIGAARFKEEHPYRASSAETSAGLTWLSPQGLQMISKPMAD